MKKENKEKEKGEEEEKKAKRKRRKLNPWAVANSASARFCG